MTKLSVVDSPFAMNQGEFEIITSLGAGATAEVFKARNIKADRYVALKSFLSFVSQDSAALARLRDEIQILKTFDHPNVVKMMGEHMIDNQLCLELELVEGYDLREWMEESRNPLIEADIWILVQVARGLGVVHEKGIIHRDLKPENILISKQGDVKLSDFGLAKELNRLTMTKLGLLVGSLGYMAPEVTEGEKSCIKSDLFSFGAIAYELLSGQAPIHGETAQALIRRAMEPVTPLNQVSPHVPPRVANLVDQCLSLDKNDRPESIWAVESELMGYINGTGLLPDCRDLLKEKPDHKVLKRSLLSKQQYLKAQVEKIKGQKKPDKKHILCLINEFQRLYPEDSGAGELLELLRKQNGFRWPHPMVLAPLFLIFISLLLYATVDWKYFRDGPQDLNPPIEAKVSENSSSKIQNIEPKKPEPKSVTDKIKAKPIAKSPVKKTPIKKNPTPMVKKTPAKIAKPAVAAKKASMGKLSFSVDDDVEIFVDGKLLSKAQMELYSIPSGSHKVKMVKKGFLPIENEIFVKQGKTTTIRAKGGL